MMRTLVLVAVVVGLGALTAGCGSSSKGGGSRAAAGVSGVSSFLVVVTSAGTGAGAVTLDPPSATGFYPSGTALTLTAGPDAQSFFAGWGGALAGQTANPLQLSVSGPLNIVATFDLPAAGSPRSEFTTTPARPAGVAPFAVSFVDASTNAPTTWRWDFGDGQTGTGANPTHTYAQPGRYTVTLTASNAAGPGVAAMKRDLVLVVDRNAGSPYWYVGDVYGGALKVHSASEAQLAQQVLTLVNRERALVGAPALQSDTQAERAAKAHVEDMAGRGYFDHVSPEGWTPEDRLRMTGGSGYSLVGENIAVGQRTAADVMAAWMASPGHRMNLLDPRFTHLGVGVDEPTFHWAKVLVRR